MSAQSIHAAFGPWHGAADHLLLSGALERRLCHQTTPGAGVSPRIARHQDLILVDLLTPATLLEALDVAARGRAWACGVFLEPQGNPRFGSVLLLRRAVRSPTGITVHRSPAVTAALAAHVALLRARRPAAWTAIDAARELGSGLAAAAELGCSHQAVNRHLRDNHVAVTHQTRYVLHALLGVHAAAIKRAA